MPYLTSVLYESQKTFCLKPSLIGRTKKIKINLLDTKLVLMHAYYILIHPLQ